MATPIGVPIFYHVSKTTPYYWSFNTRQPYQTSKGATSKHDTRQPCQTSKGATSKHPTNDYTHATALPSHQQPDKHFKQFLEMPREVLAIVLSWEPFPWLWTTPPYIPPYHRFQHPFQQQWHAQHIFNKNGKKMNLDHLLQGSQKETWQQAITNELGCLSNGIPEKNRGTNMMRHIHKNNTPQGKKFLHKYGLQLSSF